jgi:hypothetical protein
MVDQELLGQRRQSLAHRMDKTETTAWNPGPARHSRPPRRDAAVKTPVGEKFKLLFGPYSPRL